MERATPAVRSSCELRLSALHWLNLTYLGGLPVRAGRLGGMTASDDDLARILQIRDRVTRAIDDALRDAEQIADNATAWNQTEWLAATFAVSVRATARLRARIARRWRDAEGLTLGQLADRLRLSRGRTGDIIRDRGHRQP